MILDKEEIKRIIPYDEPFLFVDGIEKIENDEIVGFFQTKKEDDYFRGHFVDFKIMPGVLVVEALAQISTILLRQKMGNEHKEYHYLAYNVRGANFYSPIFPGDKIILRSKLLQIYDGENLVKKMARVKSEAYVGEILKADARFSIAIVKKDEFETRYATQ